VVNFFQFFLQTLQGLCRQQVHLALTIRFFQHGFQAHGAIQVGMEFGFWPAVYDIVCQLHGRQNRNTHPMA
jgi:hypothetical protein